MVPTAIPRHGGRRPDEPSDGVIGNALRDLLRRPRTVGTEPVRGPVQGAKEPPCRDRRIAAPELPAPHALVNQRTHAAFVAIAFGDNGTAQGRRQGVDLEVGRRSFELVEQASYVSDGERPKARGDRPAAPDGVRQRTEQPVERTVLAEEEDFVLA